MSTVLEFGVPKAEYLFEYYTNTLGNTAGPAFIPSGYSALNIGGGFNPNAKLVLRRSRVLGLWVFCGTATPAGADKVITVRLSVNGAADADTTMVFTMPAGFISGNVQTNQFNVAPNDRLALKYTTGLASNATVDMRAFLLLQNLQ